MLTGLSGNTAGGADQDELGSADGSSITVTVTRSVRYGRNNLQLTANTTIIAAETRCRTGTRRNR